MWYLGSHGTSSNRYYKTSLSENVNMIKDTIEYLCVKGKEVIFDAEHFYDGYKPTKSMRWQL
ncbi:isopropylmalate/homocitrate/citramalate synthase [Clostridium beijerinckii]|uniref:Isopropylmalate/homocitrate/citramalate synthase n=1 Tax=Clostridium beijerinckii TaxID=1520 RepID=A0AAE5LSV8_CLOBE|nr:isopropylmalate/homocitrate/citramalate synthase [Clostridium beijerinckii]